MGYNISGSSISLAAKLTPYGRKAMVSNNNALITSFSLGDSDANYFASNLLISGQIPAEAGNIGPFNTISNSTTQNANLKSVLVVSSGGVLKKLVDPQSSIISSDLLSNGQTSISGVNITHNVINRNNYNSDSLVNLFYSFGLPLNAVQDNTYTGITFSNGGFSNTSLSGLAKTNIVVLGIDNSTYGETIDGKQIKIILPTTGGTYTIYSTFQNIGASLTSLDANTRDISPIIASIDSNIALLFSDQVFIYKVIYEKIH